MYVYIYVSDYESSYGCIKVQEPQISETTMCSEPSSPPTPPGPGWFSGSTRFVACFLRQEKQVPLYMYTYIYICMYIYIQYDIYIYVSTCLSIHPSIHPSLCLFSWSISYGQKSCRKGMDLNRCMYKIRQQEKNFRNSEGGDSSTLRAHVRVHVPKDT